MIKLFAYFLFILILNKMLIIKAYKYIFYAIFFNKDNQKIIENGLLFTNYKRQ